VSPPATGPLRADRLRTRADLQDAVRDLAEPLGAVTSPGGARVVPGDAGVLFSESAVGLEGFARPLWGLVPLAAGGGRYAHWEGVRRGLASGTHPGHPEFWGFATRDQRMVEMAALGFGLAFAPEELWEPLPSAVRENLVRWLERINQHDPVHNNWQLFRVMVNLGLERVGRYTAHEADRAALDRVDAWYHGDGWYRDGEGGHVDWYLPWAFHVYGLIYAAAHDRFGLGRAERARHFRERARAFAAHHQHWFDAGGAALPYGRSLTYRFAQGAFWGALALADEEALPWGRVKGLWLRHLRDWASRPVFDPRGILTTGYGYANPAVVEPYSSPASPFWAFKFFLALAAPPEHPFWRAEEEPLPGPEGPVAQGPPGWVLSRDTSQVVALCGGQRETLYANGAAKYGKLAYSSRLGFSVRSPGERPHQDTPDSTLALREPDGNWRLRDAVEAVRVEDEPGRELVFSRWRPWHDVVVDTVLAGRAPWHWRVHRVRSGRALLSCETGFSLGWEGLEPGRVTLETLEDGPAPLYRTPWGVTGIRDLEGGRTPRIQVAPPNTSLLFPRSVVPVLHAEHAPGSFRLATAVVGSDRPEDVVWRDVPEAPAWLFHALERLAAEHDDAEGGDHA